jgi:hypothetical protein
MADDHPETDPHFVAATRLWRELVAAPPAAALSEERFTHEVAPGNLVLIRAGHDEEALQLADLGLDALARHPPPTLSKVALGRRRSDLLVARVAALQSLGHHAAALATQKEAIGLHEASPPDPDDFLVDSIQWMGNTRGRRSGRRRQASSRATSALAKAERVIAAAEQRYGAEAFAGARIEIDRSRGDVLARQAEAASPAERRRLLAAALATYRAALSRADALGGAAVMHGTPPSASTSSAARAGARSAGALMPLGRLTGYRRRATSGPRRRRAHDIVAITVQERRGEAVSRPPRSPARRPAARRRAAATKRP